MTEKNEDEIEVIDVSLNEQEIDEMIAQLSELKEHKESVQIPIAADLDLSVTYDKDSAVVSENDNSNEGDGDDDDSGDDNDGGDGGNEDSDKLEEVV